MSSGVVAGRTNEEPGQAMKTFTALALIATVALSTAAAADGFTDPNAEIKNPPKAENADGGIQRKVYLPYRDGPVDQVQPQEVMPLVKAGTEGQTATPGAKVATCAGKTQAGWNAVEGLRLQEVLAAWAACDGWTVQWQTDRQYVLQASATFQGDFVNAAANLVGAFSRAEPPVFGEFFQANKVVVVKTPTELDAQ